jgi:hypothetical protein
MAQSPQSSEQLPEALFGSAMRQLQQQLDDLAIAIRLRPIPIN